MHDVCAGPHPDVNILARHGSVDHAGYNDCRERNTKGDLRDERARGAEGRTGYEGPGVVVNDNRDDHVKGYCDALFEEERLFEILWILKFGLEGEECDVTG